MLHLSTSPSMRSCSPGAAAFCGGPSSLLPSSSSSSSSSRGRSLLCADAAAPSVSPASHHRAPGRRGVVHVHASSNDAADAGLPSSRETAERRHALLKYVREVQPALIDSFLACGPPAVVSAMKGTITNMLGTLPPQFFTVTISTVGENLSQLMLSVMMTGYLFKNTQYRLDLHSALGGSSMPGTAARSSLQPLQQQQQQPASASSSSMARSLSAPLQGSVLDDASYAPGVQKTRVQGDVLVWHKENGVERLDAVSYIELLEAEVTRLRSTLEATTQQQQQQQQMAGQQLLPPGSPQQLQQQQQPGDARPLPVAVSGAGQSASLQHSVGAAAAAAAAHSGGPAGVLALHEDSGGNALLDYLRALDPASLAELTGSAGSEVAVAMDAFVSRLMGSDRDSLARAGSDCTAQELAKVMLWLMIVGYELRGLEMVWDTQMTLAD